MDLGAGFLGDRLVPAEGKRNLMITIKKKNYAIQ
jgi:hypothetical protein